MTELECLPFGVGYADDGVSLLVRMGPHRILLDCGLTNLTSLVEAGGGKPPADLVLCSHAHPDHAKGLLALHRTFPRLPIYASEVTTQLMLLNWLDQPEPIQPFCHALPWRSPIEFAPGLSATLYPAGHLPGATAILLTYMSPQRTYTLFYTGDFLLSNSRLVEGLPLEELRALKPNVLIVEASYGTARHPHRRQQENHLAERILGAIANQQCVLFPAPTLGLGQELLMLLRSHHQFTGRNLDIWVDGSVATGCDVYLELLAHFPSSVQNFARHQPLFWDDRVRPRVRRLPEESGLRRIALSGQMPYVLITDETADFQQYLKLSPLSWLLLLPQQPGRAGAIEPTIYQEIRSSSPLQSGMKAGRLMVDTYLLSEHCDGPGTTQLIHNLRPQHVVFAHGPATYQADLASLEELQNRYQLHIATTGTLMELPIGEIFAQPAPPESRYEGELMELEDGVMITLPDTLLSDPRWQQFSETGVVEARWQGEELVIKGITPRELLSRSDGLPLSATTECCETCVHFRSQRCWNQASPLFGFRVTPDGYCPAYEAIALQEEPALLDDEEGDDEVFR